MSCPGPFVRDQAALEAGLAAVPGSADPGGVRAVVPLPSGGLNANFRVVTLRGEFVLRVADCGTRAALLGIDRQRERLLQSLAADSGLAPRVLAAADDGRWQVRAYVQGAPWDAGDFGSPRQIARLGAALRRLQAIPVPPFTPFDPSLSLHRWREALLERSPVAAATLEAEIGAALAAFVRLDRSRRAPSIVHSDLHGGNVLDDGSICFIDWEYAQVADPLAELGSLLALHPQLERHAGMLLAEADLAHCATREDLACWTSIYRCVNSLWRRLAWEP